MDDKKEKTGTYDTASSSASISEKDANFSKNEAIISEKKPLAGISRVIFESAKGVIWAIIALILGITKLPFGAMPFGFALLCAASSKLAYIYTGLLASAIFSGGNTLVYLCAYTITLLVRVLGRVIIDPPFTNSENEDAPRTLGDIVPFMFSESVGLRLLSSAAGAFITGIYSLLSGGFMYYDLFGAVIGIAAAPIATYLFCGISAKDGSIGNSIGKETSDMRKFAAVSALLFAVVLGARDINILGISLSLFVAMFATLYFCRHGGVMYGIVVGTVVGLAYSPMLAPIFAFAAISSGALFGVSTFFASLSAATVGFAWGLYSEGISALTSILPSTLSACIIFAVTDKLYFSNKHAQKEVEENTVATEPPEVTDEITEKTEEEVETKKRKCELLSADELSPLILLSTEKQLFSMRDSFSSLSALLYDLSEKKRTPSASDLRQICDNVFDSTCYTCKSRGKCWESEYTSSLASVSRLCAALSKNGHVDMSDVPPRMLERCTSINDIINNINRSSASYTEQLIVGDKTEVFAIDYEAISSLLCATVSSQKEEFEYRKELSERACSLIDEREFPINGALVYGSDRKRTALLCFDNEDELYSREKEVVRAFEELLGERLCRRTDKNNPTVLILSSAKRFSVEYAKRSLLAKGEECFCGDTVSIFDNVNGNFFSFISDGMGSGREAALTSNLSSMFLSKMLPATGRCELSIQMLSDFLRNQGSIGMHECSATVDLLKYDYLTGNAEFYKGGAAPSYIFRDGNLIKLRSNTVPLGIIKELDVKKTTIDTSHGDVIIMVSDGVAQSREECPWLLDLLRSAVKTEELSTIADMIVNEARARGGEDDISVVVVKVKEL